MIRQLLYFCVLAALLAVPLPVLPQSTDGGEPEGEEAAEAEAQQKPESDDERAPQDRPPDSDGDFRPREEISEDYPVPLPADI